MSEMNDPPGRNSEPDPHLSEPEKRNIVEHFIEQGQDLKVGEVEEALEAALKKISPSEQREEVIRAMEGILGNQN